MKARKKGTKLKKRGGGFEKNYEKRIEDETRENSEKNRLKNKIHLRNKRCDERERKCGDK